RLALLLRAHARLIRARSDGPPGPFGPGAGVGARSARAPGRRRPGAGGRGRVQARTPAARPPFHRAPAPAGPLRLCRRGRGGAPLFGVAVVGISTHVAFARRMIELSGQGFAAFNNQSIAAFLLRFELLFPAVFEWRMYHLALAYRIVSVVVLMGGVAGAW